MVPAVTKQYNKQQGEAIQFMQHKYYWNREDDTMPHLHSKDFNGASIDDQLSILGLHFALEPSMGGVILEQVGLHVHVW